MPFESEWRIISSQILAVASVGGAAVSTASLSSETYMVELCAPGLSTSSTAGIKFVIGNIVTADSTSAILPANWVSRYKCTPGQQVSAISNDAATPTLTIVQMSK
jgi:hypothetical protein